MVRNLTKWIEKHEKFEIIFFILLILTIWHQTTDDSIMKVVLSTITLPLFICVLELIMKRVMSNNEFNVELYLASRTESEIVWKLQDEGKHDNYAYINIDNTGDVNIYSLYLRVSDYKNVTNYYTIKEDLQKKTKIDARIPYEVKEIKEIAITCELPVEYRTKRFYGIKSGDDEKTIFGEIERISERRKAITFDKEFEKKSEKMIKYKME